MDYDDQAYSRYPGEIDPDEQPSQSYYYSEQQEENDRQQMPIQQPDYYVASAAPNTSDVVTVADASTQATDSDFQKKVKATKGTDTGTDVPVIEEIAEEVAPKDATTPAEAKVEEKVPDTEFKVSQLKAAEEDMAHDQAKAFIGDFIQGFNDSNSKSTRLREGLLQIGNDSNNLKKFVFVPRDFNFTTYENMKSLFTAMGINAPDFVFHFTKNFGIVPSAETKTIKQWKQDLKFMEDGRKFNANNKEEEKEDDQKGETSSLYAIASTDGDDGDDTKEKAVDKLPPSLLDESKTTTFIRKRIDESPFLRAFADPVQDEKRIGRIEEDVKNLFSDLADFKNTVFLMASAFRGNRLSEIALEALEEAEDSAVSSIGLFNTDSKQRLSGHLTVIKDYSSSDSKPTELEKEIFRDIKKERENAVGKKDWKCWLQCQDHIEDGKIRMPIPNEIFMIYSKPIGDTPNRVIRVDCEPTEEEEEYCKMNGNLLRIPGGLAQKCDHVLIFTSQERQREFERIFCAFHPTGYFATGGTHHNLKIAKDALKAGQSLLAIEGTGFAPDIVNQFFKKEDGKREAEILEKTILARTFERKLYSLLNPSVGIFTMDLGLSTFDFAIQFEEMLKLLVDGLDIPIYEQLDGGSIKAFNKNAKERIRGQTRPRFLGQKLNNDMLNSAIEATSSLSILSKQKKLDNLLEGNFLQMKFPNLTPVVEDSFENSPRGTGALVTDSSPETGELVQNTSRGGNAPKAVMKKNIQQIISNNSDRNEHFQVISRKNAFGEQKGWLLAEALPKDGAIEKCLKDTQRASLLLRNFMLNRKAEMKIKQIMDIDVPIITIDYDCTIVRHNKEAEKYFLTYQMKTQQEALKNRKEQILKEVEFYQTSVEKGDLISIKIDCDGRISLQSFLLNNTVKTIFNWIEAKFEKSRDSIELQTSYKNKPFTFVDEDTNMHLQDLKEHSLLRPGGQEAFLFRVMEKERIDGLGVVQDKDKTLIGQSLMNILHSKHPVPQSFCRGWNKAAQDTRIQNILKNTLQGEHIPNSQIWINTCQDDDYDGETDKCLHLKFSCIPRFDRINGKAVLGAFIVFQDKTIQVPTFKTAPPADMNALKNAEVMIKSNTDAINHFNKEAFYYIQSDSDSLQRKNKISQIMATASDYNNELDGSDNDMLAIDECIEMIKGANRSRKHYYWQSLWFQLIVQILLVLTTLLTVFTVHCDGDEEAEPADGQPQKLQICSSLSEWEVYTSTSIVVLPILASLFQTLIYTFQPKGKSARLLLLEKRLESEMFKFRTRVGLYDAFDSKRKGLNDGIRKKFVKRCEEIYQDCIETDFRFATMFLNCCLFRNMVRSYMTPFTSPHHRRKKIFYSLCCRIRFCGNAQKYGNWLVKREEQENLDLKGQSYDAERETDFGGKVEGDYKEAMDRKTSIIEKLKEKVDYENKYCILSLADYKKKRLSDQHQKFKGLLPRLVLKRNLFQVSIIFFTSVSTVLGALPYTGVDYRFLIPLALSVTTFLSTLLSYFRLESRVPVLHKDCFGELNKALLQMNSPGTIEKRLQTQKEDIVNRVEESILSYYFFLVEDQLQNGKEKSVEEDKKDATEAQDGASVVPKTEG